MQPSMEILWLWGPTILIPAPRALHHSRLAPCWGWACSPTEQRGGPQRMCGDSACVGGDRRIDQGLISSLVLKSDLTFVES